MLNTDAALGPDRRSRSAADRKRDAQPAECEVVTVPESIIHGIGPLAAKLEKGAKLAYDGQAAASRGKAEQAKENGGASRTARLDPREFIRNSGETAGYGAGGNSEAVAKLTYERIYKMGYTPC